MTPAARLSAAIDILDRVLSGESAERQLTNWARSNRYAGSKDRAAIRDHVFDALRCLRSYAWCGGAGQETPTGRQLIIGMLAETEQSAEALFGNGPYAPSEMTAEERAAVRPLSEAPRSVRLDCPDWLVPRFEAGLGTDADASLEKMRRRADMFLRINRRKATLGHALEILADDGIEAEPHELSETALKVTKNPRAVARSQAYLTGLVEIQDVGSQALTDLLPLDNGMKVLDYCAGGGGKSLAMGARANLDVHAHDIDVARMQDIAPRASRADIKVQLRRAAELDPEYDLVFCDVPCSGAGAFARSPQGKWALTPARLQELQEIQAQILQEVAPRVAAGGLLAYATCSVFKEENDAQVRQFMSAHGAFSLLTERQLSPLEGGDGFYVAVMRRDI